MHYLTLIPAYGRDYKSKVKVIADWEDGKDFRVCDPFVSGYLTKRELEDYVAAHGPYTVNIRYNRLERIATIVIK
jgi:hypothetical protein